MEKICQLGEKKVLTREDTMRILFSDEKCLIVTASITVKMIVYGPLIGKRRIGEVEKKQQGKFAEKVMV